ncbi:sensor histidine kinase [bacterium]|nr:sensor histidine kinase [bacterium]
MRESLDRFASGEPRQEHLEMSLKQACEWSGACRGHLFEYLSHSHQLRTVASWHEGRLLSGPAPDDPPFLQNEFPADHNSSFYKMVRLDQVHYLGPQGFLDQVWPATREWHREAGHRCAVALPLVASGRALGEMAIIFSHEVDWAELPLAGLRVLSAQAGLAILLDQLEAQNSQLVLEQERRRLARELHDGVAQVLNEALLGLSQGASPAHLEKLMRQALEDARRSVQALRAAELEGSNLAEALRRLAPQIVVEGIPRSLDAELEHQLFRVAQEGLSNANRHARAAQVGLRLRFIDDGLELLVQDDGVGFDPNRPGPGFGLQGLQERVLLAGGRLDVRSQPGQGTCLKVCFPT